MFSFALYTLAVFVFGFFVGMIFKQCIDKEAIREVVAENRKLHRENWNLKKRDHVEIINISDKAAEPECYFEPF